MTHESPAAVAAEIVKGERRAASVLSRIDAGIASDREVYEAASGMGETAAVGFCRVLQKRLEADRAKH